MIENKFSPDQLSENIEEQSRVILLRHSQPEYLKMLTGKTWSEALDQFAQGKLEVSGIQYPEGFNLAQEIGQELKHQGVLPDLIVSSPFERAKETAILIAGKITEKFQQEGYIPITIEVALAELEPNQEAILNAYQKVKHELSNADVISSNRDVLLVFRTALGEWLDKYKADIEERVNIAINRLKELSQEKKASMMLVISHGILLRAIKAKLEGREIDSIISETPFSFCQGFQIDINFESGIIRYN